MDRNVDPATGRRNLSPRLRAARVRIVGVLRGAAADGVSDLDLERLADQILTALIPDLAPGGL